MAVANSNASTFPPGRGLGWSKDHLLARHKGDPHKVQVARELRARTTMPLAWIAQRLHMGSRGYAAWLLQQPAADSTPDAQGLLESKRT